MVESFQADIILVKSVKYLRYFRWKICYNRDGNTRIPECLAGIARIIHRALLRFVTWIAEETIHRGN